MLTITRTLVFRDFQRRLGNCSFHINSAYVGLEWIARGQGKPEDFEINWDAPKKPRESVDQARQLIHSAMLGHVYDALDSYLRLIADIPWSYLSTGQRNVLRKSVTRPGGSAYSIADRFAEMHFRLDGDDTEEDCNNAEVDLELLKVLVAWRNQTVHDGLNNSGELRLPDGCEEKLLNARDNLAARYGDLDPIVLLAHIRQGAAPKRKEIIALVSACQNFVRAVDSTLLRRSLVRSAEIQNVAFEKIRETLCKEKTSDLKRLWGKGEAARIRRLKAILESGGFAAPEDETTVPIPTVFLPDDFIENFARNSIQQALKVLGLATA
jgi:hypothetical protein